MKINISNFDANFSNQGNLFIGTTNPPIDFNINSKLILEPFTATKTTVNPFEEFELEWSISTTTPNVDLSDYDFRLKTHYNTIAAELDTQGSMTLSIYKKTLITMQAKFKGSGVWRTLGTPINMFIDDSTCETKSIPGALLDIRIEESVTDAINGISGLRFRSGQSVEANWFTDHIEYKFPLEIVLSNFFNGDFDITWKLYFSVDYDSDSNCHLEVNISSNNNANFHWLEDVASIGHSATIAATIERLMPMILQPKIDRAEESIISEICTILNPNNYFDTHRMLSVKIVPALDIRLLEFVFCEV